MSKRISLLNKVIELLLLLVNVFLCLFLLCLSFLVIIGHQRELGLALHTSINDLCELFLILLLYSINVFPSLVLNRLSFILVGIHESLDLFSELSGFPLLLLELVGVLLLEVLEDLLVVEKKVVEPLLELLGLFLLLSVQLLVSLMVGFLLVGVVLLSARQLLLVGQPHLSQLLIVHPLHLTFLVLEGRLPLLKIDALCLDIGFDPLDLLLSGVESVLHPALVLILQFLN